MRHKERHHSERIGWLRAAVMGANDGILSIASLILGITAAGATGRIVLITGIAGLVAGAMSMAAGEYVSVSSQADTQKADMVRDGKELDTDDKFERAELVGIYVSRGLDPALARQVSDQLMVHDALGALASRGGGASPTLGALRVTFWGGLAMALTYGVGTLFGTLI